MRRPLTRRRGVVREGLHELPGRHSGGGVLGHIEVDDAAAMVSEHDETEVGTVYPDSRLALMPPGGAPLARHGVSGSARC